tara:strand:- start:81 stop:287 length:207 start_codon:yes stop_codon:yes gene_type:complete
MEKQLTKKNRLIIEDSETKEVWEWKILDHYVYVTYAYTEFADPEMDDFTFQYVPNDVFDAILADYKRS